MTRLNVRISNPSKRVQLGAPTKYDVGVNYQIPSKALQYNNIILDSIVSQFNGSQTTFNLYDDGKNYFPINDQQLIVSQNDVILEPAVDFFISGHSIVFTNPPSPGDDVWIIALVTTADLTRTVNFLVDSGSLVIVPGVKGSVTIDVSGIIESWKILSDQTGILQVDILKSNFQDFPTFTSICGISNRPTINNTDKGFDDVLSGWDTAVRAGDIFKFEVINSINIKRFLISFKLKL
jgi:hypothetical protein